MHKLVWIVGGSTGIGAETALQMSKKGYRVAVSARSEGKLKALTEQGKNIYAYPCDVTKAKSVNEAFAAIEDEQGAIDIVLLNAGTFFADQEGVEKFTAAMFKKTFDINVNGIANCLEPVLKTFTKRGQGHIGIVASVAGFRGLPKSLAYGPSKAALINLSEALYIECKPLGIKVQLINPGFIRTPLTDKNDFEMPMLMEVEDAATKLIEGLESDRFEITFPWVFVYLSKLIGLLPNKAYLWLIAKATQGKV